VLESLDTLRKNGRLSGIQAIIASALNIKPVMGATPEGTIFKLDQARGIVKALLLMAKAIEQDVLKPQERILGIAHCNNYERALFVKDEILKRIPFKDCFIVDTAGVSSMYASEGGIITAY
jgi:fatty acid-binding protein DegV